MMNGEYYGVIGGKSFRPTKTIQDKVRNGQEKEVSFMRFTMFCEDMTKKQELDPDTNKMRRPTKPVQVILPENQRGSNLFEYLEPGRHVFVKGRMTSDPRSKNGKYYENEKCYMAELTFLDSPRDKQMERALKDMVFAEVITKETSQKYLASMNTFYAGKTAKKDAPRLVFDERKNASKSTTSEDPDHTDFAQ